MRARIAAVLLGLGFLLPGRGTAGAQEAPVRTPRPVYYGTRWTQPSTAPTAVPPGAVLPVQAQMPRHEEDRSRSPTRMDTPGQQRLFRVESEQDLRTRIRVEARERGPYDVSFPQEPVLPRTPIAPRRPTVAVVEPAYVCYQRLMFEEKNSERHGWDLGAIGPFVSTADFYLKVFTAPLRRLVTPCWKYDSSAGNCLPGDPVPYLLGVPRPGW
jgi:hypothetical protein